VIASSILLVLVRSTGSGKWSKSQSIEGFPSLSFSFFS
jgi:hypothetical protein